MTCDWTSATLVLHITHRHLLRMLVEHANFYHEFEINQAFLGFHVVSWLKFNSTIRITGAFALGGAHFLIDILLKKK